MLPGEIGPVDAGLRGAGLDVFFGTNPRGGGSGIHAGRAAVLLGREPLVFGAPLAGPLEAPGPDFRP
jgi:hypothetical protein